LSETQPTEFEPTYPEELAVEIGKTQPLRITAVAPEDLPAPSLEENQAAAVQAEATPVQEQDFDSAFAWLESLAARQGADEETLITPVEQRTEQAPEWVQHEVAQPLETQPEPPVAAEPVVIPVEELPPAEFAVESALETPQAEVPEWLQSIEEEAPVDEFELWKPEELVVEEPVQAEPEKEAPLPDWLQSVENEPQPETIPGTTEAMPDWLSSIAEDENGTLTAEPEPSVPTNDIRLAWEPEAGILETPEPAPVVPLSVPVSLEDLQEALNRGEIDPALEGYNQQIKKGTNLPETIHALREALYRYPVDISIWQTLGDAYAANNQLQDALDAYTKAEELLR
jgi:tetratricopeptide (TPR) repeat protein